MARFGLSRKAEYAVIALARLAQQRRSAAGEPGEAVMSARELAETENLPLPVVSGLLKQLQRARLVASKRGVHGGYHLPVEPGRIRLASVIRAVEDGEPVQLARCCGPDAVTRATPDGKPSEDVESCRIVCTCPIRHAVQSLDQQLSGFLETLTLDELMTA